MRPGAGMMPASGFAVFSEGRMLAEQILKVTDKKKKVVLEDGSSFVLYAGEVRRFHIREGEEVPQNVLDQITGEVLQRRAKLRCMNLLKASDRTVKQLRDRLKRDGYPESIIEQALSYVASYHYTDDRRYAENYIRSMTGRKSRRVITLELEKRGVLGELIAEAFSAFEEEAGEDPGGCEHPGDRTAIRRLMEKKNYDAAGASFEDRKKMIGYLARRGFSMEDIMDELRI